MFDREAFEKEKRRKAKAQYDDVALRGRARDLIVDSDRYDYGYQWTWLGLPAIQLPQDMIAIQEIIWANKPNVIIETGIAWGGSTVFYASLLHLIGSGTVIGIDLNLMSHVSDHIMSYPFSDRITLYKGSSTDVDVVAKVRSHVQLDRSVMVILDSNHTHEHVLDELRIYGPLVTPGQYLIVADTIIEDMPAQTHRPRAWGPGHNPKTALQQYLAETKRFEIDACVNNKLLLTFAPGGYCRCVRA